MVLVLHYFSFVTIVLCSLVFVFFYLLSLGVALHYIHAFHPRCFFYSINKLKKKKKRKEGKRKHIVVLALFSLFLKTRLVNLFSHDMFVVLCLVLMSLFTALHQWKLCRTYCVGKMFMMFITLSLS